MNPELYQYYTRDDIFAAFPELQPTEAEGWFLSSERLVGLFAIGERPPDIHFCDDSRFHWYGGENETVPQPIQDFRNLRGGYLFIKSPNDERYAYACQIQHVGMFGDGRQGCEAQMDIDPRIPTGLLHELGGLYVHPDGDAAINRPVVALRAATSPAERFSAFQTFVQAWRGPIEECDALTDDELAKSKILIPSILEKLYRWAGHCNDVMNAGYLSMVEPERLCVDDNDYVAFCVECQWCGNYYIRSDALTEDDPEVFADECGETRHGAGYHATGIGLSQFFWAYFIAFNLSSGPISQQMKLSDDEWHRLKETIEPLPVLAPGNQSCRAVQAYRSEIHVGDQTLIFARDGVMGVLMREEHSSNLNMRSKSHESVNKLLELLNIDPTRLRDLL